MARALHREMIGDIDGEKERYLEMDGDGALHRDGKKDLHINIDGAWELYGQLVWGLHRDLDGDRDTQMDGNG